MIEPEPKLFADEFMFLEAPKWHQGLLWVSDVFDHKVYALSAEGQCLRVVDVANRPSGLGFLSDGTLIIVSAKDCRLLRLDGDRLSEYADLSNHAAGWLNDFAIDPDDRIYVGNFGYDFVAGEPRRTTSLHRVDTNGTITTVADNVDFPNGSVVINEGRTLVVAETWEARLTAFDIDATGELSNRRIFADLGQRQPDGLCADADGAVWVGIYNTGEFVRVLDGGEITNRLQFPGSAISCTLGGAEGRTLYLTAFIGTDEDMAAGKRKSAIFKVDVDVPKPGNGKRGSTMKLSDETT
ncbi:gluconolactonase [Mesorhizobium sp. M4A.F.Ca.ET.050.02.1.1]|uniref:SMP-30/gluconolactonase/LRE family protein n=1 Tax=Mesorhizobium sp. M4A.F.Ca.ET.050.02.1.1 TaxID=2496754 RepID=UPI000FCBA148|nr:SMP-30/gluconolactonase/LRE family protein [Mesorhizobium sp. M4A.F.Ca.ET.050.02.1.1]RUX48994.1 gluconolactonase [Mesorhizobium sp. M4A.F.Ca.ET.050.02.1.1]TIT88223.1 MAG: SMP-30/gluconolactonase/LRE family protein [Mesorhizobium sp.]